MNIRPMKLDDIPAVVLVDTLAGILLPWSPAAYAAELRKPTSWCWVCERLTEQPLEYVSPFPSVVGNLSYPAGTPAVIGSLTLWDVAGEGEIANVAVHPQFWRQGVGRALLQTALHQAALLGLKRILLEVRASNQPAQHLYRSFGFIEDGRRPRYYSNGEDAILMSLRLNQHKS
ncbi:MAG: ribosomal-protein-alanine N-acetyltransferase [Anaerolineae bacterium]|nr:MAG: ribosomal-protein-alanine N-acetyltransferase [Anaerolineae bacterium]